MKLGVLVKYTLATSFQHWQGKFGRNSGEILQKQSIDLRILRIKKIEDLLNLTLQISTHQFRKIFSAELLAMLEP